MSEKTNKGFKGLVIELTPEKITEENKKVQYRITAWFGQNDTVGTKSKLGAFISAFTDYFKNETKDTDKALEKAQDTNNWLKHMIKIVSWKEKNREVKVVS